MTTCILGIDPGLSGAAAFYFPAAPDRVAVYDMPVVAKSIDAASLARRIEQMRPDLAIVENVGARPGQGVSSMFRFGVAHGAVLGALAALNVPTHLVSPTSWKRHFKLDSDKEAARALAIRLWPACDHFGRKKDHGRAEAALIARWAAETLPAARQGGSA